MSKFGKQGRRCDYCGKFSTNKLGEYLRKDGTAGYIWPDGDTDEERNVTTKDICEECSDVKHQKKEIQ